MAFPECIQFRYWWMLFWVGTFFKYLTHLIKKLFWISTSLYHFSDSYFVNFEVVLDDISLIYKIPKNVPHINLKNNNFSNIIVFWYLRHNWGLYTKMYQKSDILGIVNIHPFLNLYLIITIKQQNEHKRK